MAIARVHAAEFTLRDPDAPAVSNLSGRLTSSSVHVGTELLSASVTDAVSGIYRYFLEIDGKTIKSGVVDPNDGRCADAGVDPNTPYEFLYREPCRKSAQVEVSLDTRQLSEGDHALRVSVEDAAGNRSSMYANPTFTVRNAGPASSTLGSSAGGAGQTAADGGASGATALACAATGGMSARFAQTDRPYASLAHRQRFTIKGRAPAGADIDVFHLRGSKVTPLGSFRTGPGGNFTERFRALQGNGKIQLCGPGVAVTLTLRVKAKVTLKVRLSRRGLVRYSGRVATGQIPKGGKIVAIQGKAGRSWQTFALRRTDKTGRFKGRYRLRVVIPGTKLKFRVRVPSEAGYPFVGVVGRSVTKRVR